MNPYTSFGVEAQDAGTENEGEVQTEDVPFVTGIKALFKNKYWIMMTGMLALFFLMYSVNGGATVYYAKDILGDKNLVSTINGIFNIVQICGMFFIAMLVKISASLFPEFQLCFCQCLIYLFFLFR